jgi:hypothetical protein
MKPHFRIRTCVTVLISLACFAATRVEAQKRTPLSELAVDSVTLKSGQKLRGAFIGRDVNRVVSMAVQRKWLKENGEDFYNELVPGETAAALQADGNLAKRVQSWLDEKPKQNLMVAFLKGEIDEVNDRIATTKEDGVDSQFVVVRFLEKEIRSKYSQKPASRKIALLAWQEEYKNVETRPASELLAELERDGLKPPEEVVDLSKIGRAHV